MSDALKILIVEDELVIAEMLKTMLLELNCQIVGVAKNYKIAKNLLEQNQQIDLVFLDINLTSDKSGIDIANLIKDTYQIPFIYLTSYSDPTTIIKASKTIPEAYLNKPFNKTLLFTALEVFKQKHQSNNVYIKDGIEQVKLDCNEILFIKKDGNYLEIYTKNRRYTTRETIESFILKINSPSFIRVHRSYAVDLLQVKSMNGKDLKIDKYSIPYSRTHKEQIRDLIKI